MVILNLYGMNFDAVVAKSSEGALAVATTDRRRRYSAVCSSVLSATLLPFDEFSLVGFSVLWSPCCFRRFEKMKAVDTTDSAFLKYEKGFTYYKW